MNRRKFFKMAGAAAAVLPFVQVAVGRPKLSTLLSDAEILDRMYEAEMEARMRGNIVSGGEYHVDRQTYARLPHAIRGASDLKWPDDELPTSIIFRGWPVKQVSEPHPHIAFVGETYAELVERKNREMWRSAAEQMQWLRSR